MQEIHLGYPSLYSTHLTFGRRKIWIIRINPFLFVCIAEPSTSLLIYSAKRADENYRKMNPSVRKNKISACMSAPWNSLN